MEYVTVLYDTKDPGVSYAASLISLVLGPAFVKEIGDDSGIPGETNLLVLGLGKDSLPGSPGAACISELSSLLRSGSGDLPVAAFSVTRESGEEDEIAQCVQGWCNPVKYVRFYADGDLPRRNEVIDFALGLVALARTGRSLPPARLRVEIDAFLSSENTCTLCTGYDGIVRATPVEYHYHDGALYILSEGGVKFANILRNPGVGVAVYRPYRSMESLMGVQLTGKARLVTPGLETYAKEVARRGIDPQKLDELPFTLHLIEVKLQSAEFLDGRLAKKGFAVRQLYTFGPPTGDTGEDHE